jgi:hypothetical protein
LGKWFVTQIGAKISILGHILNPLWPSTVLFQYPDRPVDDRNEFKKNIENTEKATQQRQSKRTQNG